MNAQPIPSTNVGTPPFADTHRLPPEGEAVDITPSSSVPVGHSLSDTSPLDPASTAETTTDDPVIVEDDPNLFDYTYTLPSKSTVQHFDPTSQLGDQLTDLSSDILNTLTTDTK